MTELDAIGLVAFRQSLPKETCERAINGFLTEIKNSLIKGEDFKIRGLMNIEVIDKAPRKGRNPKTGEVVTFPAKKGLKVKFSKILKNAVNGK